MGKKFWLDRWESGETPFNLTEVHPDLIEYFPQLKAKQSATVLVPLCGKSIDMIWLLKQGCHVIGVELSPIAVESFFKDQRIQYEKTKWGEFHAYKSDHIDILCGDFFSLNTVDLPTIDVIYDRAALIALPQKLRQKYADILIHVSNTATKMLLKTLESDDIAEGPPYPVNEAEVQSLYGEVFRIKRLKETPRADISPHLQAKGYCTIIDIVYELNHF